MADRRSPDRSDTEGRAVLAALCSIGAIVPVAFTLIRFEAGGKASDFLQMWHAARAAIAGGTVYGSEHIFPYPPHALFLFVPFSLPPYEWGYLLFNFAGIAFFLWTAKVYLPRGLPPILAICSPATLFCLFLGQTGLFIAGLWLLAFQGRWAAVAALTFKPHLGLLSLLSLKRPLEVLGTALLVALLVTASVVAFGTERWVNFAGAVLGQAGMIGERFRWLVMGVSPAIGYGFWGWVPFAAAAAFLLVRNVNAFTAATAALLISPYGFHYDMPVASLGFAIAIYRHWTVLSMADRTALVSGFLVPVIVNVGAWWAPPILLWALWVQVRLPKDVPAGQDDDQIVRMVDPEVRRPSSAR